jgi:hypothetical protein
MNAVAFAWRAGEKRERNFQERVEERVEERALLRAANLARYPPPWDSSKAMLLANFDCSRCLGAGSYPGRAGVIVCPCVYRRVFRACYSRYRDIGEGQACSRLGSSRRRSKTFSWERPREDFRADFELIARRVLEPEDWLVFRLHFLRSLEWLPMLRKASAFAGQLLSCGLPY